MLHGMYISLTFINLFCVALECSGGGQVETGGGATDLPHTAPHGTPGEVHTLCTYKTCHVDCICP